MSLILLDTGLVGHLVSVPRGRKPLSDRETSEFRAWYDARAGTIHEFVIADVTRYEIRRELVRKGATAQLRRLDRVCLGTIPAESTGPVWDRAAELWAMVRGEGKNTASDKALDGDAILAATALLVAEAEPGTVVATTNVKHLAWFGVDARAWRDIPDSA